MVPGKDVGPGDLGRGEGAHHALHRRGRGARARRCSSTGAARRCRAREGGYYIGPTIIDHVTPDMRSRRKRCSGRCSRSCARRTWTRRCAIENASPYGNAASVFTESGGVARYVMERASAGMVGVNVGVPVPREPFSFGGWNDSQVRRRRHHRARLDRVLDAGEEDDHEVEPGSRRELDVVTARSCRTRPGCHAIVHSGVPACRPAP